MEDLRITLIQTELAWEDSEANLSAFESKINSLEEETDLILLPEMFNTAFSMDSAKLAQGMSGEAMEWMGRMAGKTGAVITGSVITEEENKFYNRLIWMHPDGSFKTYDKRHLFRMAEEEKHFSGGNKRVICEVKGWKVLPLVCYDLRFPVWARNRKEYDLLVYVANWPCPRISAWRKLLMARAIENQSYVAGLNRIGKDGNGFEYCGSSLVADSKGEVMYDAGERAEMKTVALNADDLLEFRKKFPVALDADDFEITL